MNPKYIVLRWISKYSYTKHSFELIDNYKLPTMIIIYTCLQQFTTISYWDDLVWKYSHSKSHDVEQTTTPYDKHPMY